MIRRALDLVAALGGGGSADAERIALSLLEHAPGDRLADSLVEALERIGVGSRPRGRLWVLATASVVLFAAVGGAAGLEAVTRALALDWGPLFLLPLAAVPLAAGGVLLAVSLEGRERAHQVERAASVILERLLAAGADETSAIAAASYVSGHPEEELAPPFGGVELRGVAAVRLAAAPTGEGTPLSGAPAASVALSAVVVVVVFWTLYFFAIGASALSSGLER